MKIIHSLPFTKYSHYVNFKQELKFTHNKKYLILLYSEDISKPLHSFHIQIIDSIHDSLYSSKIASRNLTVKLLDKQITQVVSESTIIDPYTNQSLDISHSSNNSFNSTNNYVTITSHSNKTEVINTAFETDSIIYKDGSFSSSLDVIDKHVVRTNEGDEIKEYTKTKLETAFVDALNNFNEISEGVYEPLNLDNIKESYNKYGSSFYNLMRFVKYNMLFNKDWLAYDGAKKYKDLNDKENTKQYINVELIDNSAHQLDISNSYVSFNNRVMPNGDYSDNIPVDYRDYWNMINWVSDNSGLYKNIMDNPAYNGLDTRNSSIFAPDVSYTINLLDKDKNIMGISGNLVFTDTSGEFPKMGIAHLHDQSGTNYGQVSLVNAPF